jgi:hypothetical protein
MPPQDLLAGQLQYMSQVNAQEQQAQQTAYLSFYQKMQEQLEGYSEAMNASQKEHKVDSKKSKATKTKDASFKQYSLFGDESEDETSSSGEDDLKRQSVGEHKKMVSGIKKGVDPDVGEYQIDLNQPDSFSIPVDIGRKSEVA